jgi:pimeloyl-ACP methyl ester carboxylesterase
MTEIIYQSIITSSGVAGFATTNEDKPPLILVTGYTGTLFHWNKHFVNELAKIYQVYLLDNRKVGLSNSVNEDTISGMAQDLYDFMIAAKINKPVILGWSMGGMIVQEFCKKFQYLIQGICLISSVPNVKAANKDFYNFILNKDKLSTEEINNKLSFYLFSRASDAKIETYLVNNAVAISNYSYRFTNLAHQFQINAYNQWQGMQQQDYNKINCPVLLLWAKDDNVVPQQPQQYILNSINESKLIAYASGGHFVFHQKPHKIAHDIINYFT